MWSRPGLRQRTRPRTRACSLLLLLRRYSTSGDYATDVLGDPWDFSNDEDVPPVMMIGTEGSNGISRDPSGVLTVSAKTGSIVKLIRTWGMELPWGRDGLLKPADAATYSRLSFSMNLDQKRNMAVEYWTESGGTNIVPFTVAGPGWATYDINLNQAGLLGPSAWSGKVIALDLLAGNSYGGSDAFTLQLDWARLHRADASATPVSAPIVQVLSPSDEGGADYATVSGNPWDMAGPDDVVSTGDIINGSFDGTSYNGTTHHNDSFVELPLRTPLITDRYHRATMDVCYGGGFSFANAPGGGMNARFAWFDEGGQIWSETQDIVVYPGCNRMTVDLATDPAVAVNDENTIYKAGWRGLSISAFRFDLDEDPGDRAFSLRDIRLADDAAFSSGTFPVTFNSSMSGSADVFVTTTPGAFNGTKVGTTAVVAGANTFNWDGSGLPNGTYWVYVTVHSANTVGTAYSTGPVRIERPVSPTRSYFVPLNPARLLDTRTGVGGNISGLASNTLTELKVTGVGGVPPTGATAVVMNVTVDAPYTSGFITAWPSGEAQPTVSNLNFVAGQTVPNLVTVKVGANGRVNLYNSQGFTQVVADVVGYYTATPPPGGGLFTAVNPGRVLDTRLGAGIPVGPGQSINVPVTGIAGVPSSGVSGVALERHRRPTDVVGLPHRLADRRGTTARLEPQLRARSDGGQPRAGQGRRGRSGQHLQLRRLHSCHRRCRRILLVVRRDVRPRQPGAHRRQPLRHRRGRSRPAGPRPERQHQRLQRCPGAGKRDCGGCQRHLGQLDGPGIHHRLADQQRDADCVDPQPAGGGAGAQPGLPEVGLKRPAVALQQRRIDRLPGRRVRLHRPLSPAPRRQARPSPRR